MKARTSQTAMTQIGQGPVAPLALGTALPRMTSILRRYGCDLVEFSLSFAYFPFQANLGPSEKL